MSQINVNTIGARTGTTVSLASGHTAVGFGGGKVLQVVGATRATTQTTTSTSLVDVTGMTVDITPAATSSKILIKYSDNMLTTRSSDVSTGACFYSLLRDSTVLTENELTAYDNEGNRVRSLTVPVGLVFLDSPSTTSQVTYKIQMKAASSTTVHSQTYDDTASIVAMEIGA